MATNMNGCVIIKLKIDNMRKRRVYGGIEQKEPSNTFFGLILLIAFASVVRVIIILKTNL